LRLAGIRRAGIGARSARGVRGLAAVVHHISSGIIFLFCTRRIKT
jgi:hypothetical protein